MIVYIAGGLGNQMFEYAYARALQLKYNIPISFDLCELEFHGYEERKYGLENLNIEKSNMHSGCSWVRYVIFKAKKKMLMKKTEKLKLEEQYAIFNKHNMIVSIESYRFHDFVVGAKTKYMYGNFQSWKYFVEYEDIIKKELRVVAPTNMQNDKMINEITMCEAVCVHIRRGDYVANPEWSSSLNICTYHYYVSGMSYIKDKQPKAVFFIFSNTSEDIDWIKKNYDFSEFEVRYVCLNNPDYEELRLMYNCKHFVLSNSTFSWWAQYLSESQNKIVIAPKTWNLKEDASDLYQENWIVLDT